MSGNPCTAYESQRSLMDASTAQATCKGKVVMCKLTDTTEPMYACADGHSSEHASQEYFMVPTTKTSHYSRILQ